MVVKAKAKKQESLGCLVVTSKIKKLVKQQGFRSSGDFSKALSEKVNGLILGAIERMKADGARITLGSNDLQ
jgi:hypothetical protein